MIIILFWFVVEISFFHVEYVLIHSGLPVNRPEKFSVSLQWKDVQGRISNTTLNLQQSRNANSKVVMFSDDAQGKPKLDSVRRLMVSSIASVLNLLESKIQKILI